MMAHEVRPLTASVPPPSPPRRRRPLSDGETVLLAAAVAVGAWAARPVPLGVAAGAVLAAVAGRRPWLFCAAAGLCASVLGARAEAGLTPARPSPFRGTVTLVADPVVSFGGVEAVVRAGGRRYQLEVGRRAGGPEVASSLAGERLVVSGRLLPPPEHAPWLVARHVVGRLRADRAEARSAGSWPWRLANGLRRSLVAGSLSLPPDQRSLFTGFVLGDDRDQTPALTDDFRGSGLTHLLAVSGENVAFVLVLAGPALRRLGLGGRWVVTLTTITFFALLTRFEPSVLRASVMAALSATAFALGRPTSSLRLLALAVGALVLVDPLLVHSVGFGLSVAACVGIVVLGPAVRRHLPGPRWLVDTAAVTLSAQVGVAPIQLLVFGGLPVASIPANVLAAPAAGFVMMWGLGAGLVAGIVTDLGSIGPRLAALLHWPTRVAVTWVEWVARQGARLPMGELGWHELVVIGAGLAALIVGGRGARRGVRRVGIALLAAGLLTPTVMLSRPVIGSMTPAPGATLWRGGGATVLIVSGPVQPGRLLEGLRRVGVRRIDVVVSSSGGVRAGEVTAVLRHRWPVGRVLAPRNNRVPGATVPGPGSDVRIGTIVVRIGHSGGRLVPAVRLERPG